VRSNILDLVPDPVSRYTSAGERPEIPPETRKYRRVQRHGMSISLSN
jgi:hypothetical protein